MKRKSPHEPYARVMSAADAIADADRLGEILRRKAPNFEPAVEPRIPLVSNLAALDHFPQANLMAVENRLDEQLLGR